MNIGFEQDGTNDLFERPVLVIKKFNRDVLWILPLTRSDKKNRYYVPISVGDKNSMVILSQLRLISAKRLQRYMHKLPKGQFKRKKLVSGKIGENWCQQGKLVSEKLVKNWCQVPFS